MNRPLVTDEEVESAIEMFREMLSFRLKEKGQHTFASRHEILGIIQAEMGELVEAVEHEHSPQIVHELLDIAVGAVFGAACINAKKVDW